MKITKDELLKIAKQSSLKISDEEAVLFADQIKNILEYADQLQQVGLTKEADNVRNVNVLREDIATSSNAQEILNQAPQTNGRYFVVPKILD